MTGVRYKLQAYMADNDVGKRSFQTVRLRLANARVLSRRRANRGAPLSTYLWSLEDAAVIGLRDLDERDAAKIFAIGLSVQSWRFLHSPVILSTVAALDYDPGTDVGRVSIKLTSPTVVLDEQLFLQAAQGLKAAWMIPGSRGDILREAINSYWDALHAVLRRSRILSLWAALEKAVNDDGKSRPGGSFDRHAATATGWEEADIKRLRDLTRWLKHSNVVAKPPPGITDDMDRDASKVKQLADRAIASRLNFPLSTVYEQ